MTAPSFVATSQVSTATGTLACSAPTGLQSGDYEIAWMTVCTQTGTPGTDPTGWALLENVGLTDAGGDSTRFVVYEKTDRAQTGQVTWTHSATTRFGHVTRTAWRDTDGLDKRSVPVLDGTSGTSHVVPATTPTNADSCVIAYAMTDGATSGTFTFPGSPAWTEVQDFSYGTGGDIGCMTAGYLIVGATSTGVTITSTNSDEAIVGTVVLLPAAAAPTPDPATLRVVRSTTVLA